MRKLWCKKREKLTQTIQSNHI